MAQQQQTERQKKFQDFSKLAKKAVLTSAMTLAAHELDPERFASVVIEAVLAKPEIMDCTEESIAKSLRQCCQDGLIPNGREAFIDCRRSRKSGKTEAHYMPMKDGVKKIAFEILGVEIHTGVFRRGDKVEIVQGAGVQPSITIKEDYEREQEGEIIGAYAWGHIPDEKYARLVILDRFELERRKNMTRAKNRETGEIVGPWKNNHEGMCQKSVAKTWVRDVKHRFVSATKGARMLSALDNDNDDAIIDITPTAAMLGSGEEPTRTTQQQAGGTRGGQPAEAPQAPAPHQQASPGPSEPVPAAPPTPPTPPPAAPATPATPATPAAPADEQKYSRGGEPSGQQEFNQHYHEAPPVEGQTPETFLPLEDQGDDTAI